MKIVYGDVETKDIKAVTARLTLNGTFGAAKFDLDAVAAGMNKEHAQINLHAQLQEVYEKIGDAIVHLRDEIA